MGRKSIVVQMDLQKPEQVEEAHRQVEETLGPVQILVNNAGMISDNLFIMLEEEDWGNVLDANVMGTVRVSKQVIRGMIPKLGVVNPTMLPVKERLKP